MVEEKKAETKADKNNTLKIVLIVVGVLVLGSVLIYTISSGLGDFVEYYDDGIIKKSEFSTFTDGRSKYITYYRSGIIKQEQTGEMRGRVLNGKGEIITYYENGHKKQERRGTFNNGALINGFITNYDRMGQMIGRETFPKHPLGERFNFRS